MIIKTVDNFQGFVDCSSTKKQIEKETLDDYICKIDKNYKKDILEINLDKFLKQKNNIFFSFFTDEEKREAKNQDDLIISVQKELDAGEVKHYTAQSGNYVGKFVWDGLEIDIQSRFSNIFLERMLNFANDIFLDDVSISANKSQKLEISKYIIYYMFVQTLEKAFLLGLPKAYTSVKHHDMKLKGKIDINRFIKHDIPFQGKISSVSREQKEIQEIIDILYKAVKIIDKSEFNIKNISHIKTHLKQHRSNHFVSNKTFDKALKSKALQNPIFAPYKKVLEYAKIIIDGDDLEAKKDETHNTYGFLINVAELFEIYVTKLLRNNFPGWSVESPKIDLYKDMFYTRKIIPDIVMIQDKKVMVFDTKYKRMQMRGRDQYGAGDVDRGDFFQINTYMSYYQNHQKEYHLLKGGLLYPMDSFDTAKCHNETWFDNPQTKFIVDGIDLSEDLEAGEGEVYFQKIIAKENAFLASLLL